MRVLSRVEIRSIPSERPNRHDGTGPHTLLLLPAGPRLERQSLLARSVSRDLLAFDPRYVGLDVDAVHKGTRDALQIAAHDRY